MAKSQRIIVVANRLPVQRVGRGPSAHWERAPGGLVSAMTPILHRTRGTWIGWTGTTGKSPAPFVHDKLNIHPVRLSEAQVDLYYYGFCNRTLWPLFHDAICTPEFNREFWDSYVEVNSRFAHSAARAARRDSLVWVHDYQLLLVPGMLRELRPDLRIGFFLHIPFPPEELFAWLPWRQAIVRGLLGADLVGFQTVPDSRNFARVARRYAPAEGTDTQIDFHSRSIQIGTFPISIDYEAFVELASRPETTKQTRIIRDRIGRKRRIILAVDRLDYTKGIEARLRAFEELLRNGDITVDDCVLVQVAVPSREVVQEYEDMRTRIEQTVGRINGQFSQPGRVAVHYFRRNLPPEELVSFYRAADVMMVTPLRDGMNLVAKEYVAARTDDTGVLVLSEFAGAARELRRALLVNPRDMNGVAAVMMTALNISEPEARKRMTVLRMTVRRHDVFNWADEFLTTMSHHPD